MISILTKPLTDSIAETGRDILRSTFLPPDRARLNEADHRHLPSPTDKDSALFPSDFPADDSISFEVIKFQWQLPTTPQQAAHARNPWNGHIETETQRPLTAEIRELLRANNH